MTAALPPAGLEPADGEQREPARALEPATLGLEGPGSKVTRNTWPTFANFKPGSVVTRGYAA